MKEITIDTITNEDEYTVPKTEKNMLALMNADYTKPTLIVLEDTEDDIVCVISTEVQGFYTDGDDDNDDNEDDDENNSCENENRIFSSSYDSNIEKEKNGLLSKFRH